MKYSALFEIYNEIRAFTSLFLSLFLPFTCIRGTRKYFNYAGSCAKFLPVSTIHTDTRARARARFDCLYNETYKCSCALDSDWNFRRISRSVLISCPTRISVEIFMVQFAPRQAESLVKGTTNCVSSLYIRISLYISFCLLNKTDRGNAWN